VEDDYWMRRALEEGHKGVGCTSPNPPVGAVLVRDGKELACGFHQGPGQPHAEIEAFHALRRKGGEVATGATLYVTLEPCSTRGRTGACTEAIKREKVGRVVFGALDPNPAHAGAAVGLLEEAGISVTSGVLQAECESLIRAFHKVQTTGLPWVIAKTAMSLDGRITRPPGEGQWLSGSSSRTDVQQVRSEVDAILTSGKTVRADDPQLTVRGPAAVGRSAQPWRVILTSREDGVPEGSKVLTDEFRDRTILARGRRIESVLRDLVSEQEVSTVLVEAGGRLLGRLMDEGWIDELIVYLAPLMTGGPDAALGGEGVAGLGARLGLSEITISRIDNDVRIRGLVQQQPFPLER
jgi:diaminohydroxyphosphoribosylaminopyrimidine deaminase/5-amino-6-(5-phosphoribosylamino)uracil reductase